MKKGSVSVDIIFSSLIFISTLLFVFYYVYQDKLTYLADKSEIEIKDIEICKIYIPLFTSTSECNNVYLIDNSPLYGSVVIYNNKTKKYFSLLEKGKKYFKLEECEKTNISSDIIFDSNKVENTYITIYKNNSSINYADQEMVLYYPTITKINGKDIPDILLSNNKVMLVLPFSKQVVINSNIIINTTYFETIYDGSYISISNPGLAYNKKTDFLCYLNTTWVCFKSPSLMNIKIYNLSNNMSIEINPSYNLIEIGFGNELKNCMNKNRVVLYSYTVYYNRTCLKDIGMEKELVGNGESYDLCWS